MDATIAVSEPGVNVVLQKAIALAHAASSDTATWGPFQVGYSASVALSGGVAVLENAPANKLDLNNVNVAGSVSAFFTFDLGLILPTICIPPFQVCVDIPFIGNVCTPQFCIPWPSVMWRSTCLSPSASVRPSAFASTIWVRSGASSCC